MQDQNISTYLANDNKLEDDTIDLVALFKMYLKHWRQIALSFLVVAILFSSYAYLFIQPTYSATTKMYIVSSSEDSMVNLSDLNLGQYLTADYEELLMTYSVLKQVIDKLDLDMDYKQLAGMISLENPEETRMLYITVTSPESKQAMEIANALADVAEVYFPETMNTLKPNIAERARDEHIKVGPSYKKYTLLGGLFGAIICCGILLIGFLMDDRIYTQEQMEELFGTVPLAAIPECEGMDSENEIEKKKKKVFGKRGTR